MLAPWLLPSVITYGYSDPTALRSMIDPCRLKKEPCTLAYHVRPIVKYVAFICLLLTLWSAVALVAHHHAKGVDSACTICVAAHSAAPAVAGTFLRITFTSRINFQPEPEFTKGHFVAFALSVRPPPAV